MGRRKRNRTGESRPPFCPVCNVHHPPNWEYLTHDEWKGISSTDASVPSEDLLWKPCPWCDSGHVILQGRRDESGAFFGCSEWPLCGFRTSVDPERPPKSDFGVEELQSYLRLIRRMGTPFPRIQQAVREHFGLEAYLALTERHPQDPLGLLALVMRVFPVRMLCPNTHAESHSGILQLVRCKSRYHFQPTWAVACPVCRMAGVHPQSNVARMLAK